MRKRETFGGKRSECETVKLTNRTVFELSNGSFDILTSISLPLWTCGSKQQRNYPIYTLQIPVKHREDVHETPFLFISMLFGIRCLYRKTSK